MSKREKASKAEIERNTRLLRESIRREEAEDAARLEEAKAEAATRGKEAFELDRFESLWTPFSYGRSKPERDQRVATWEHKYYVQYTDIMTLKDFAEKMAELEKHGAFD